MAAGTATSAMIPRKNAPRGSSRKTRERNGTAEGMENETASPVIRTRSAAAPPKKAPAAAEKDAAWRDAPAGSPTAAMAPAR